MSEGQIVPAADPLEELGSYRRRLFVEYYLGEAEGRPTVAARMAGYESPDVAGSKLLQDAKIRAIIRAHVERVTLTSEEILARLARQARGSILDVLPEHGRLTSDFSHLTREQASLIKRVKIRPRDEGDEIELELYCAQTALTTLGKWHGLWTDRLRVDVQSDPLEQWDNEALVREMEARGFRRSPR